MPTDAASHSDGDDVLLAVEHDISAELLADRLDRAGLAVRRVKNGRRAESIMGQGIGVVVAEVRLGGRTGLELVRGHPPLDPPIILLGRRGNDEEVVRAFDLGAADYITRPFSPRIATARIRRFHRMQKGSAPAIPKEEWLSS
jgi:DNA-binding response OmpR family regulator